MKKRYITPVAITLVSCVTPGIAAASISPVFIAQHNAEHTRFAQTKKAEPGTGEIARIAAEKLHSQALVQEQAIRFNTDSIRDRDDQLAHDARVIMNQHRLIIDIHGMSDQHGADVIIGHGANLTDWEKQVEKRLVQRFHDAGWSVKQGGPFQGTADWSMSGYADSVQSSALQIELAPSLRQGNNKRKVALIIADSVSD